MANEKTVESLKTHHKQLFFFNTESRKKEPFESAKKGHVKMYTCGPTIYNYAHIGNFRTYVFEDLLRRTLKFFGYEVHQVMNLTDVDDKTIRGATEKGQTLAEFVLPYKNAFFADIQTLGIEKVENYPAATDYISHMIDFIERLISNGHAYKSKDKSVYFSIAKFAKYGRLSRLKLDELKVGAGESLNASDEYEKDNIGDFVLWKAYDPSRDGKIFWESPFGPGRPGWHLECSAMAISLLGETLDIHVGAVDNIFPHHENEIAQSEAFTDQPFVRYWLHSEHLVVNHKKMSKSLGNFYTLRDLLQKGYTGTEVRYMLLNSHYRTQLNFTFEGMDGARSALTRLNDFLVKMYEKAEIASEASPEVYRLLLQQQEVFREALADDLNISQALAALFDLMPLINKKYDEKTLSGGDAAAVLYFLEQINRVLGIFAFDQLEEKPPEELQLFLEQRNLARASKEWARADQLRNAINERGYVIEDTPSGARLKKK